jgi:putative aldouronate transport system permease protein
MTVQKFKKQLPLHLMMLPAVIMVIIFSYVPMYGIVIAFQKFVPAKGIFGAQRWIGLDNFRYIFSLPDTARVFRNTIFIAAMKIILGQLVPLTIALLLNEIRSSRYRRSIQTIVYLPHFLSWVILSGLLLDILSLHGIVNQLLGLFGADPISFLGNKTVFPYTLVVTDVWKSFGFNTIVYLAAITGIDPGLYEAAIIDGARRARQMWHITLPGMAPIIVLLAVMSLGNVLNAGFEQVFNLYSPAVYETGDIIDTLVYRLGFDNMQYSLATAMGLFKSVVSSALISVSYYLAYRLANYRVF